MNTSCPDAPARLKSLDAAVRRGALDQLLAAWRAGEITLPPASDLVNLHCHTCFSYNGYDHSPSSLAWLAREQGWHMMATVDFDVLDGVEETLAAGDTLGVRVAAGLETRTILPEFAAYEINSPGEPGVSYHIGVGLTRGEAPAEAKRLLAQMRRTAAERNRDLVARVNAYLDPVTIDYDRDVLPLTPADNATERHILIAYDVAARRRYPQRAALLAFWAAKLRADEAVVDQAIGATPSPSELVRGKLMKRGGVGYVPPGPQSFPSYAEVTRMIIACGAIPVLGWLDGASAGEQRMDELLDLVLALGVGAVNIVPDRNWNIADGAQRAIKVRALNDFVEQARARDLPILVGTEMNKAGQPLVDDFDAAPLRPLRGDFLRGANWLYGHTALERALGRGYQSAWARSHLPARRERNAFYAAIGAALPPGQAGQACARALAARDEPAALLAALAG
jgi:hypothetical protein